MPLRNVPLATGVYTTPSLAMKIFAVPSSAMLPSRSRSRQLSKPRPAASTSARALFGYRQPALASTGIVSIEGRRNGDSVMLHWPAAGIGVSYMVRHQRVVLGSAGTAIGLPLSAQYIGRM